MFHINAHDPESSFMLFDLFEDSNIEGKLESNSLIIFNEEADQTNEELIYHEQLIATQEKLSAVAAQAIPPAVTQTQQVIPATHAADNLQPVPKISKRAVKNKIEPIVKRQKFHWTSEHDAILLNAIEQYGKVWKSVANKVKWRTPKQCQERYKYYLDPTLKKGFITEDEKYAIVKMHVEGTRDNEIAKCLKRSRIFVKNYMNTAEGKKLLQQYIETGKFPIILPVKELLEEAKAASTRTVD